MRKKLNFNGLIACFLLIFLSNGFFKIWASDPLRDLDIENTLESSSTYKIKSPLLVLMVEHAKLQDIDHYQQTNHGTTVWCILHRYITPCESKCIYVDFNDLEKFFSGAMFTTVFQEPSMPFINCSYGPSFEVDDDYLKSSAYKADKSLIECALKNNKILIFAAGNRLHRCSKYLKSFELTKDQRGKLVFVGALDKTQKPSLYSGIHGKGEIQFIWAKGCPHADQTFQDNGTSLAAPRVTGTLCRLKGIHPDLTPQEALDIVFLTATKACFFSTGDQELDNYLYGPYGALDPMTAFQFADEFVAAKQAAKELSPQDFYMVSKRERGGFPSPKTLRDQLNLMAFLEQHYNEIDSDDTEQEVFLALQRIAKKVNLRDLYSQSPEFFIPDDLYALGILMNECQDTVNFEALIKHAFKEDVRSSQGWSILHHVVSFNSFELVNHYAKALPILVNDLTNTDSVYPLQIATIIKDLNLSIIRFLLEQKADIYGEGSPHGKPLYFILEKLSTLEEAEDQAEKLKEAAFLFLQHKDYDPQKYFPEGEESLEEYAQRLKLDEKYPKVYQMLVGKQRLN